MPAAVFIFIFCFCFCCEAMKYELRAWTWRIFLIFMQYCCWCCCFFLFFKWIRQESHYINTKHWEKNDNKMPSMHKISSRISRHVRCEFFSEQYFALYFQTVCRVVNVECSLHQLRPSKCHFNFTTIMSYHNDVCQQMESKKYHKHIKF